MQAVPATGGMLQAKANIRQATSGSTSATDMPATGGSTHAAAVEVVPATGGAPEAEATNMPATGGSTSAAATALDAPSTSGSAPVVLRSVLRLGGNLSQKDDNGAPALPPKSEPRKSKRPSHIRSPPLPTHCIPPGMPTMLPMKDPEGNDIPVGTVLYKIDKTGTIKFKKGMDRIAAAHAAR